MTARHRLSKLLLRQGIIYSGGKAWTGKHEAWLRAQRFDAAPLQWAYDTALDAMLATLDRRNRLDAVAQTVPRLAGNRLGSGSKGARADLSIAAENA